MGECQESHLLFRPSPVGSSGKRVAAVGVDLEKSMNVETKMIYNGLKDVNDVDRVRCSTVHHKQQSESQSFWPPMNSDLSFNPMCEPSDHWPCKFDESPELKIVEMSSFPVKLSRLEIDPMFLVIRIVASHFQEDQHLKMKMKQLSQELGNFLKKSTSFFEREKK